MTCNFLNGYFDAHFWWICSTVIKYILDSLSLGSLQRFCLVLHLFPHGDKGSPHPDASFGTCSCGGGGRFRLMSSSSFSEKDAPLDLLLPSSSSEYSWRSRCTRHWLNNVPDILSKVSAALESSSCIGSCCFSFPMRSLLRWNNLAVWKNIIDDWSVQGQALIICCNNIIAAAKQRHGSIAVFDERWKNRVRILTLRFLP